MSTPPLTRILQDLIERSRRQPEQPVDFLLSHGLHIHVSCFAKTNSYDLKLSRADTCPSLDEWHTVIMHWPYPVMSTPIQEGNALKGTVPGAVQLRLL